MKTAEKNLSESVTNSLVLSLFALYLVLAGYWHGHSPGSNSPIAGHWVPTAPPAAVKLERQQPVEEIPPPGADLSESPSEAAPSVPAPDPAAAPALAPEETILSTASPGIDYKAGEDPEFARRKGWPVKGPEPLPGALLPEKRIVAFYGNPLSWRMGILGKSSKEDMLHRLKQEVTLWQAADPSRPVQPALHLIAVTAQTTPGRAGKYRMIMLDEIVTQVYDWAKEANALLFIDIQTGHDDIRKLLPRFEWILKNPDVHVGIDPEFNLGKSGAVPGTRIGSLDAEEVNYISGYLRDLVKKYDLPPKILTVHRFTQSGVTNSGDIELCPEIQIVMHMDGWGRPWLKRDTYERYIVAEPVQYAGFKLFYHNDTKKGGQLMTPEEVLRLNPKPLYIQYQ